MCFRSASNHGTVRRNHAFCNSLLVLLVFQSMDSRTCKAVTGPDDLQLKRVATCHNFQKRTPASTVLTCHLTNRTMHLWPSSLLLWKKPLDLARNSLSLSLFFYTHIFCSFLFNYHSSRFPSVLHTMCYFIFFHILFRTRILVVSGVFH